MQPFLFFWLLSLTYGCNLCGNSDHSDSNPYPFLKPNIPKEGDVSFTSRSYHANPMGNPNTHPKLDTWGAFRDFHGSRIDWIYTYIQAVFWNASNEFRAPVTAAINSNMPDLPLNGKNPVTYDVGRIEDVHGKKITAPWMRAWKQKPYWGCANNPAYMKIALNASLTLLELGSTALQHDDPGINAESVKWGACYCSFCMQKFAPYVLTHASSTVVKYFNITSTWNYKNFLNDPKHKTKYEDNLRVLFEAFQTASATEYQKTFRKTLFKAVGKPVTLSCNNGARWWYGPYLVFDYGMGELSASQATPYQLYGVLVANATKKQLITMPKWHEEPNRQDVFLIQKSIGYTYSLGGNMMVPWDIYLPTPHAERFYGNVSDFAHIYKFVRDNKAILNDFRPVKPGYRNLTDWIHNDRLDKELYVLPRRDPKQPNTVAIHISDWSYCGTTCKTNRGPVSISLVVDTLFSGTGLTCSEKCLSMTLMQPNSSNLTLQMKCFPNLGEEWVNVHVNPLTWSWGIVEAHYNC